MIDQKKRDGVVSLLQPAKQIQSGRPGFGSQYAIAMIIFVTQVSFDSAQHIGIIVNRQDYGLCHRLT
jgi:hypothetical protein